MDLIDLFRMGLDAKEDAELGFEETALGLVRDSSLQDVEDDEAYYLEDEEEIEGVEHGLDDGEYFDAADDDDDYAEEYAF